MAAGEFIILKSIFFKSVIFIYAVKFAKKWAKGMSL